MRVVTLWQHGEAGSVGWTDGSCLLSCPSCGGSRSLCHHGGRRRLASDLPALWHAASTTAADRQAIIRQLSERVVITVQGESAKIAVQGHWLGGYGTQTTLIRPGARLDQLSYDPDWLARGATLYAQGTARSTIAKTLNAAGWRPAKRRATFTAELVGSLLARRRLGTPWLSRTVTVARKVHAWTL